MPVPPGRLLYAATTSWDVKWFLDSGAATANSYLRALESAGRPLESFRSVLDFGCGCGRILRHLVRAGPTFNACDINAGAVRWVRENLPVARAEANALRPPLAFDEASFDIVYAGSVFTHLPGDLQVAWMNELRRVLAPGGVLLITLSGEGDAWRLTGHDRARFESGNLVVVDQEFAGSNICAAYHPEAWVMREFADGFRLLSHSRSGIDGAPHQDLWLFERTGVSGGR